MARFIARVDKWKGFTELQARSQEEAEYRAKEIYGDDETLTVEYYSGGYDWEPERTVKRGRPREKR